MKSGLTVAEAKRFEVFGCSPHHTLLEASQKMVSEDISALVIVDDAGDLCGVITRTDLLRAHLAHDDWMTRQVIDFMSTDVITVSPNATLYEVAQLLTEKHIHRVVVVRRQHNHLRPVAVISDSDLVYHMVRSR